MKFRKRRIIRKEGIKKGVYLLPNLCTTASLFCGFFAVVRALHDDFDLAAWSILLAGVFDLFDGQIARLTKAGSQFGIEYDSLADLASFGLAPAILMYIWALADFKRLGWIVAFLFFACGALRLARYNVQVDAEERRYFQGLPIPMAAYVLATTILFYEWTYEVLPLGNPWILGLVFILALLMVSTVRYRNAKQWNLKNRLSFFALVGAALALAFIAWKPPLMMWVVSLLYVASGPAEELWCLVRHGKRLENLPLPKPGAPMMLIHSNTEKQLPTSNVQFPNKS